MNCFLDPADESPGSANPRVCINGDPRPWKELARFAADVLVVVVCLAAPHLRGLLAFAVVFLVFDSYYAITLDSSHGLNIRFRRRQV